MTPAARRPRLLLALVLAVALACVGLVACGAGRGILGTNTSPCFLALPTAKRAVHGRGLLAGVRLVDVPKLNGPGARPMRDLLALLPSRPPQQFCVVAYAGRYTLGQVQRPVGLPPPGGAGRYAIVLVTTPESALIGTFVVHHEPIAFAHVHVGL